MFSNISLREQVLMAILGGSIIVATYVLARYLPAKKQLALLEEQQQILEQDLKKIVLPKIPKQYQQLQPKLTQLEAALNASSEKLQQLKQAYLDPNSVNQRQALKLEISQLAKASGIKVMEVSPYLQSEQPRHPLLGKDSLVWSSLNLEHLKLLSTYANFRRFLAGLDQLSKKVHVVYFALNLLESNAKTAIQPIQLIDIQLVLAF